MFTESKFTHEGETKVYDVIGPLNVDWKALAKKNCKQCLGRGVIGYHVLTGTRKPAKMQCICSARAYEAQRPMITSIVDFFSAGVKPTV